MSFRKKARVNGLKAEEQALVWIPIMMGEETTIKVINEIFDILVNDEVPIEVKSCSETIEDISTITGKRHGRFMLNKDQHDYLVANNGYYFFIVHMSNRTVKIKLIKAEKLKYNKAITWTRLDKYVEED